MTSFTINLAGEGAEADDVREVFETTVRALRRIGAPQVDGMLRVDAAGDTEDYTLIAPAVETLVGDEYDGLEAAPEVDDAATPDTTEAGAAGTGEEHA